MPKVRSPRGTRSRFSPARVMATITRSYGQAFTGELPSWRRDITEHAQRVVAALGQAHGAHEDSDWPRQAIAQAIEDELRTRAPTDVHEAYLDQHPERRPRGLTDHHWARFAAQPGPSPASDPLWSVVLEADAHRGEAPSAPPAPLADLGESRRRPPAAAGPSKPSRLPQSPCNRSHWIDFWRRLATTVAHPFDLESLERVILATPPEAKSLTAERWWLWWQDLLPRFLEADPRLIRLWCAAQRRHDRSRLAGQSWLDGSGLPGTSPAPQVLDDSAVGRGFYRGWWLEHIRHGCLDPLADPAMASLDMEALALRMDPLRDQDLDWAGLSHLAASDALWPIGPRVWTLRASMPSLDAREPPQWAFMRLAMALACAEPAPAREPAVSAPRSDRHTPVPPSDRTRMAGVFYEAISRREVIPSEAMLREAGRRHPLWCDDAAGWVGDDLDDIQAKTHQAAIATKWNGTVALDWSAVRAQGSPIAGRRISKGVVGFLRTIHSALLSHGRQDDDRPVTVSLPIWHRDVEAFLDVRLREADRLQVVIRIPDLFFEALRSHASWHLLDPGVFAGLETDFPAAYRDAVASLGRHRRTHPACAKEVSAERLWLRLCHAMEHGSPFVTLEGPCQAQAIAGVRTVAGLDGIGAFPIAPSDPKHTTVWPSAAINLARCLDADGVPSLDRMAAATTTALRLLDNALLLSPATADSVSAALFRPVCLGVVGYYEAIERAMDTSADDPALLDGWVARLSETFSSLVLAADAALLAERGPAPAYAAGLAIGFSPRTRHQHLAEQRGGSQPAPLSPNQGQSAPEPPAAHRCATRALWAPFLGAARMASSTPGGLGTLRLDDRVIDERGRTLRLPSVFFLGLLDRHPDDRELLCKAFSHPASLSSWPARWRTWIEPDATGWEQRLRHAALISPWLDQGVSLTIATGLPPRQLSQLLQRAWWLGLSNIRFDAPHAST